MGKVKLRSPEPFLHLRGRDSGLWRQHRQLLPQRRVQNLLLRHLQTHQVSVEPLRARHVQPCECREGECERRPFPGPPRLAGRLPPSPSATVSSKTQRVWNDFLSCSSTALEASNWPPATAARAFCSSRLKARLLCRAGASSSCDAAGSSPSAPTASSGSDWTGEDGAR